MIFKGKLASLKINLLFIFLFFLFEMALFAFNLSTAYKYLVISGYMFWAFALILALQSIWLLVLCVKNYLWGRVLRGTVFLLLAPFIWFIIYTSWYFLFFSLTVLSGFEPPVDDYEARDFDNFEQTPRCQKIDTARVKARIEGLKSELDSGRVISEYVRLLKKNYEENSNYYQAGGVDSFPDFLPDTIIKMQCGCRAKDTSVLVMRLWDKGGKTYLLEMKLKGDKIEYGNMYPRSFFGE